MKRSTRSWISMSMALLMAANCLSAAASAVQVDDSPAIISEQKALSKMTDFFNPADSMEINKALGTITLGDTSGDNFAMFNGLDQKFNDFTFEADLEFTKNSADAPLSGGLVFSSSNPKTGSNWFACNIDTRRVENGDLFRVFGPGIDTRVGGEKRDIDVDKKLHLKIDVTADGAYTYTFGNAGENAPQYSMKGQINGWTGGYIGLLSFCSEATFSNVCLEDRSVFKEFEMGDPIELGESFHTNLTKLTPVGGTWEVREDGLYSNAVDQGDCFLFSDSKSSDFVYSTDVKFLRNSGAAALLFRYDGQYTDKDAYAVNIDAGSHKCKFWRWQKNDALQLIDEKDITPTEDNTYTLKVVSYDTWISYYVNDVLVASTGDYTLQVGDKGQNTVLTNGSFGLLNWNGEMVFQNTKYSELSDTINPTLQDISVSSSVGSVEAKTQFIPTEPITLQYVGNDAATVDLSVKKTNADAVVHFYGADGKEYADGKNIPVQVGANYLTVTSTVTTADGAEASVSYRVNVHRRDTDDTYYNEKYRDQYHYSVKDGWANDPNGLVYYNGTYHMFYQFYDDIKWGPMHWAHSTSKDLIHWEDQPIAFYPDANGAMFSGCIVADEENTSGLFEGDQGGLVALITADGNGQRIKLAYSTDEGKTWNKVNDIAADWTDDPLVTADFRDPKVFRWEGKWFMVVAGGPLRIYSSDNLRSWKCESRYARLHTECPDMYPIQTADGKIKWVLSRGGRFYKIGDFKEVNGNWRFVPDEAYQDADGIMNFGRDSYAAMTYYIQNFGSADKPTLPDIIELNWMNTWDNYCNQVAETVGQKFNGTFNLNLKVGVVEQDGKYILSQTPISAYESLRDTKNAIELKDVSVTADNTLLQDFSGDTYEIVSTFYPAEGTKKVGFALRTNKTEQTQVVYDLEKETLSIDRSKSGIIITDLFKEVNSMKVTKNTDGSVDLHIYVDKASVEVFAMNNIAAGANQIFPSEDSLGASVIVEGDAAKADITIYPLNSIWKTTEEKEPVDQIFQDVPAEAWYVQDVQYTYDNGLMVGTSETTFAPEKTMTRAEIVQVLYNRANKPEVTGTTEFTDVAEDDWYYDAVQWAAENNITLGIGKGKFAPNQAVTREQLTVFLYRDANSPAVSGSLKFSDAYKTSHWAVTGMLWAVQNNIVNGEKNGQTVLLNPLGNATRAQCAAMFHRYITAK